MIAEGIERDEELLLLKTLGINLMQGYLLQRPIKLPQTPPDFPISNVDKLLPKSA